MRVHSCEVYNDSAYGRLHERCGSAVRATFGKELPEDAGDVRVLVCGRPSAAFLPSLPSLEALVVPWAGVPPEAASFAKAAAVPLFNLHHNALATAEHAVGLLFSAAKCIVPSDKRMRTLDWKSRGRDQPAVQLTGQKVVVFGMGSIGRHVAAMLRGMGMEVVGVRTRAKAGETVDGTPVVSFDGLRGACDGAIALVVCVPHTPATEGSVDASVLTALKGGIVVNVGRGPVINEGDLWRALTEGGLHAAALDVWWQYPEADSEPPVRPSECRFEDLSNVIMSPHRGGWLDHTESARMEHLADLLLRFAAGGEGLAPVDTSKGY